MGLSVGGGGVGADLGGGDDGLGGGGGEMLVRCFVVQLHPRPNLVHVHVTSAFTETGPSTQKLIHYHGRQGKYV